MDAQQWLERQFGCRLQNGSLLTQALSHRSVGSRNNERLEFLGDSVLGFVVSEELYRRFPDADEGQLSRLRVSLVKGSALAAVARELDLGDQLRLGAGEIHGGGRRRDSILADTLEALLGAIVLDLGIEACRAAISRVFQSRFDALKLEQARKDPKTRLQEFLQGRGRQLPDYVLCDAAGEDHAKIFTVACELSDGDEVAQGVGESRRAAEQAAATAILAQLGES
ncbi:ribonuclease III [gamma proteobacterium NOR5-3]|nr:ribonuclease III [gamma proteobacterium NOR5-3]